MIYQFLEKIEQHFGVAKAKAHCDIPCGIYDPHYAEVAALTVIRMIDLIGELKNTHAEGSPEYLNTFTRCTMIKEEHAEILKREVRVIFGDYIKKEHVDQFPELPTLTHKIFQLASKARQTTSRETALELLTQVNRFAEIFWQTKGIQTKRVKAPYKPAEEMVLPAL